MTTLSSYVSRVTSSLSLDQSSQSQFSPVVNTKKQPQQQQQDPEKLSEVSSPKRQRLAAKDDTRASQPTPSPENVEASSSVMKTCNVNDQTNFYQW